MHIISVSSYNGYKLNSLLTCFQHRFIVQSVERRTGIAEVMGSNPVEASEFWGGLSLQLLKSLSLVFFIHRSYLWFISYSHNNKQTCCYFSFCSLTGPTDVTVACSDFTSVVPLKKQQGFLNMVAQILDKLGSLMTEFLPSILRVILSLLSTCVLALQQRQTVGTLLNTFKP